MPNLRILARDYPQRSIALVAAENALIFQYNSAGSVEGNPPYTNDKYRCSVEFPTVSPATLKGYRTLGGGYGTLGLITLDEDIFICAITGASKAATARPGETISRIDNVDFYCLNRSDQDNALFYESESQFAAEDLGRGSALDGREVITDHPFLALKKLLSDGSFYYSLDFNLTDRLQDRSDKSAAFDIETLDEDMLWNSYMINPLLLLRSHLAPLERQRLDSSRILTCIIRGFASTLTIPASLPILPRVRSNLPSALTIISRQSSRRAGTRFNSRGIDDDGNVANFVETEVIFWNPPGITFSYVQVRGSVPIFWEQTAGFLPGQQKIEVTRSTEATWHAFRKHFEILQLEYGAVHVVNLLSALKSGEAELSAKFREHIAEAFKQSNSLDAPAENSLLRLTEFDFNAESQGPLGYGAADQIRHELINSSNGFAYFLSDDSGTADSTYAGKGRMSSVVLQQEGVFRTNCLDCLDRTNLVQSIISSMALESFISQQGGRMSSDIQMRHSTLWADNGDALSKIYAGTGALKSSFTRHGKMSLAGALADARKSATRLYVNNFTDKARQKTIDLLLGRLANQVPVPLYDPINDMVSEELGRRAPEYSFTKSIRIWIGTFNVNGRNEGPDCDLTPWLFPESNQHYDDPTVFAVGFQEIVELSPQQIMSTDPSPRKVWEQSVSSCLNNRARSRGNGKYVLLRSGQLVGAALLIYVKEEALAEIKNVEGGVVKTGLSGIAGNKGGCAIRFDFSNTRICFITAHLAAGFANYDERNSDYETIRHGLRFQKNRSIEDHDSIVWLGDFNYRIGLSNHRVRELISQKDYRKLYENDQLNLQMIAGAAFRFYSEGPILFPPTYKYDIGKNEYDTSEKSRVPAWCDRILWKGANLRQTHYNAADLRFSDHRPVCALFDCNINVVDESLKDKLRRNLYDEQQRLSGTLADANKPADAENGDVASPRSIAPGSALASSDHYKWWLKESAPARSATDLVPNIHRKSNPFSLNGGADWIPKSPSIGNPRDMHINDGLQRPPLPPRRGTKESQVHQARLVRENADQSQVGETETGTASPVSVSSGRKLPPPVPRKPDSFNSKRNIDTMPVSKSSKPVTTRLVQNFDAQSAKSRSTISSIYGDKGRTSPLVEGDHQGSLKEPGLLGPLPSRTKRPLGVLPAKPILENRDSSEDLLGDGDDKIGWKSLLP